MCPVELFQQAPSPSPSPIGWERVAESRVRDGAYWNVGRASLTRLGSFSFALFGLRPGTAVKRFSAHGHTVEQGAWGEVAGPRIDQMFHCARQPRRAKAVGVSQQPAAER